MVGMLGTEVTYNIAVIIYSNKKLARVPKYSRIHPMSETKKCPSRLLAQPCE